MVVGRRTEHGTEILADEHAVVRLGEGVDAQRSLTPEAIERTCQQMKVYARMAHSLGARRIKAWEPLLCAMRATGRLSLIASLENARLSLARSPEKGKPYTPFTEPAGAYPPWATTPYSTLAADRRKLP